VDSCGFKVTNVEGRYHMTAWIQFYSVFFTLIKIMKEEAKLFSPSSCLYAFSNNFESKCLSSEWEMLVPNAVFHLINIPHDAMYRQWTY
jgi:hypothetical protein